MRLEAAPGAGDPSRDHGLAPDTIYYYSARVCRAVGRSPFSNSSGGGTESAGSVDKTSVPTDVRGRKIDVLLETDEAEVHWKQGQGQRTIRIVTVAIHMALLTPDAR